MCSFVTATLRAVAAWSMTVIRPSWLSRRSRRGRRTTRRLRRSKPRSAARVEVFGTDAVGATERMCMSLKQVLAALSIGLALAGAQAQPATAPDALIKQVSTEVLDTVKADKTIQAGDVEQGHRPGRCQGHAARELPAHDGLGRRSLLAPAPRPSSRSACRTSSRSCSCAPIPGALTQVKDQTVQLKPMRAARGRHRGRRAHRGQAARATRSSSTTGSRRRAPAGRSTTSTCSASGWSRHYRNSFAQEIGANGIDGLIAKLAERNKAAAAKT